MAFIGKSPKAGNFIVLDSITTSATATYNLTRNSTAYFPASARNLIVSLNGITQAPDTAYSVSGSTITFSSALTSSDVIDYILVLGDVLSIGTPADNSVGITQLNVSDGTSGQALTTDGSGTLSFATVSSSTPTLDAVTGAGATTTNAITVGNLTSNATTNEVISINSTANGSQINFDSATSSSDWIVGISNDTTDDFLIYQAGAGDGDIRLYTEGAERLTILNDGSVGIGDSSPDSGLTVHNNAGAVIATSNIARQTYTSVGQLQVSTAGSGGILIHSGASSIGYLTFGDGATSGRILYDHTSDYMAFIQNGGERMRIGNGNVGIGESSPSAKLHVKGDNGLKFVIDSTSAANETLSFTSDNNTFYIVNNLTGATSGAEGIGFNSANSRMEFKTDGSTRMRIDSSGNVLIKRTSTSQGSSINGITLYATGQIYCHSNGTGNSDVFRGYDATGTNTSAIDADGDYVDLSDRNYKDNIADSERGLADLLGLRVVSFDWNTTDQHHSSGLIAQEVQEVIPELVSEQEDTGDLRIKGTRFYPILIKAIQEQQAIIEDLQTRLAAVESN